MDAFIRDALKSLPRWAVVAFAARCARRVEPLFQRAWPAAPEQDLIAVARAVRFTEGCAARAESAASVARENALNADLASHHAAFGDGASSAAADAAHAAANAAGSVAYLDEARTGAYYAAVDAASALARITGESDAGIRADLDTLVAAARQHAWTDATPVAPGFFLSLPTNEDEAARLEAYYTWERAGRPELSREEQELMYLAALGRVRRR